jgi:hypothetical protein
MQRDLDRIAELTKRLEELCEEGRQIRAKIARIASEMPVFPNRRSPERLFEDPTEPHEFRSVEQQDSDRN